LTCFDRPRYARPSAPLLREEPVTIMLNGERFDVAGPLTLAALLAKLGIDSRRVAVEHNLVVVHRGDYENLTVKEGDEIEIVNFVGGG
jgi:sulfur carrier protein